MLIAAAGRAGVVAALGVGAARLLYPDGGAPQCFAAIRGDDLVDQGLGIIRLGR